MKLQSSLRVLFWLPPRFYVSYSGKGGSVRISAKTEQRDNVTKPSCRFERPSQRVNSTTFTTHAGSLLVHLATTTRRNRIKTRPPFFPYPKSAYLLARLTSQVFEHNLSLTKEGCMWSYETWSMKQLQYSNYIVFMNIHVTSSSRFQYKFPTLRLFVLTIDQAERRTAIQRWPTRHQPNC